MTNGLPRYEFSERLADILGASRRDLRFRVTLLVSGGLVAPGPRGRGSPPATPDYAALLLLGTMAAPQQADTLEAIHCYRNLVPTVRACETTAAHVVVGAPAALAPATPLPETALAPGELRFGDALAHLLELAQSEHTRGTLAQELFGVWVSRNYPVSAVQVSAWQDGRRTVVTQRYELPDGGAPPAWLDPRRGGVADPGLLHSVFLPVRKLIEIGLITTASQARSTPMLKQLGPKMAALADLIKRRGNSPNRQRWEKLLATLAAVQAWSDKVDTQDNPLVEVTGFGSNPGDLRMLTYVPAGLPASAPLVVLLHGCTQSGASFDQGSGWSTLADRHAFALLMPQQGFKNNPLRCFNWFRPEDTARDSGEARSIREMVDRMIDDHAIDRRRVYVTGLSSGGAMTAVMLATYPDVFAGGAILSGVPYRSAIGLQDAFETMFEGRDLTPRGWGDLVRAGSPHAGPWPRVSIWHGDADNAVKPVNADALAKQWTDVHGIDFAAATATRVDGFPRRSWHGTDGQVAVESYTVTGMGHGAALSTGSGPQQCGTAAPFFCEAGISSTYHIARFWGLTERMAASAGDAAAATATAAKPEAAAAPGAATEQPAVTPAGAPTAPSRAAAAKTKPDHQRERVRSRRPQVDPDRTGTPPPQPRAQPIPERDAPPPGTAQRNPLGIDVHGIIAASLEAAGLGSGTRGGDAPPRPRSSAPLGLDVPGIIFTALGAARAYAEKRSGTAGADLGGTGLAGSGWHGEGWEQAHGETRGFRGGVALQGSAVAGADGGVGNKVRSISRQLVLGPRPTLGYVRKLQLAADLNDCTRASFRVLVDGVVVDETVALGMTHVEHEWLRRTAIDLSAFAGKTVTLTLEVAAYANVCNAVTARAWVADIVVQDAVEFAAT